MKEKKILQIIIDYYNKNKLMPSIRDLKIITKLKSTSTIHYYLNKLEQNGHLIRNKANKRILAEGFEQFNNGLKILKIINSNESIKIYLDNDKDYIAFKIKDNIFINNGIIKSDILIIEKNAKLTNNDLGLFKINKKYFIMKYYYQDGFYILESDIKRYYQQVQIIGKVILLERKIKRDTRPF